MTKVEDETISRIARQLGRGSSEQVKAIIELNQQRHKSLKQVEHLSASRTLRKGTIILLPQLLGNIAVGAIFSFL